MPSTPSLWSMEANAVRAEGNVVEDVASVLMSTRQWVMGSISKILSVRRRGNVLRGIFRERKRVVNLKA